jgi:hypothetical protein
MKCNVCLARATRGTSMPCVSRQEAASTGNASLCASSASPSSRPKWAGFFLRSVCESQRESRFARAPRACHLDRSGPVFSCARFVSAGPRSGSEIPAPVGRDRGNIAALLATNGTYPAAALVIPRNARDLLFVRARHRLFCTPVHNFAQTFPHNSIDAAKHCDYLPRQIEPGSVRTLRLSSKGAAT